MATRSKAAPLRKSRAVATLTQQTPRPRTVAAKAPPARAEVDARTRLLDAAERLFAERGFGGVSTRQISEAAKVNQGSIPYYFGTKEALLREVFLRRTVPVQEERHARMTALMDAKRKPELSEVLRALLEPAFRQSRTNEHFRRLAGHAATDPTPEVRRVLRGLYNDNTVMVHKVLRAACPNLGETDFYWRLYCVYGAMLYVQADTGKIQTLAGRDFDTSNPAVALQHVLNFLTAGMKAPAVG